MKKVFLALMVMVLLVSAGARATAAVARRCGVVGRCADELLEALR